MASLDKELKNHVRITILVLDNTKNALVNMFKYYLQKVRKEEISFEKFIGEHVADIKYLRRSGILHQKEVEKLIVGEKAIPGLKEDDLDVTIVRCLLDNLCPDLFMDEGCNTLQDFLKTNQHDIYHLFKFNEQCCQCAQDYAYPVTAELLNEDQYKKMFKSQPCTKCAAESETVCPVSPCTDTEYIQFDYNIKKIVFGHFSPIYKAMQKLTNIRNETVGHAVAAKIPNALYDGYIKDIEESIRVLAKICENEDEARLALDAVQNILCDDKLYIQCQNRLIEQANRDQELMKVVAEMKQQLQELTEEVRNLNAPASNLTKGNDQSGQVNQSSIDTDAEPYINNDLENKTDIFDGVVLHADEDRSAAIEFITNMRRENPDLNIDITIYENIQLGTSVFESPAKLFDNYRYLFVFVTKNFVKAELEKFLSQIATIETLTFQEKNATLIPVKTDKTYHSALAPLKSLEYDNYLEAKKSQQGPDQFFIECFRNIITDGRLDYLVN